ncbi:MAG: metal ABC transporter permease [Candidatus Nitrosotenuis sp.]|uniref:ABC-type Mn2 /Zn2 transport system, permease component n=1 Tax=Candidatus Nitrosotenuis uzonensis TaxID=1407055 RepID=A0A812EZ99_9ARCH|nr:metal ABC transporter permease [Candidatus Nitrosotenuis uzonensis]CAE6491958.1 ABC-type Mn2 /Zn2 transport system, permease component [Candidatus Nitrosotenuis uzonensis]
MTFEILSYGFMQKGLIAGIAIAVICSMMGLFLVLRRFSLFGDALAHMAFGGISIGMLVGVYPLWTAFIVSVLGALGITKLRKSTKISGDAATAVLLVSGLGIGVLLISITGGFKVDLFSFLFGNILLISLEDTALIVGISIGIISILAILRRSFLHLTFDEEQAKINGLDVDKLNYVFVALASVTVITSMRLVGILLISALIVLPNITSMMLGKSFKTTMLLSISISVISVVSGIILSYYFDLAPSGTIVMISVAILVGVLVAKYFGVLRNTVQVKNQKLAET